MITQTNECAGCQLPCIYTSCPYYNVERFYCDKCGKEATLYEYEDRQLCADCLLEMHPVVEGSEWYI